ncbi:stage IV sporulation protein FB [Xylanibacillus composti]|uniref:Stage IV sporulation protein FB n=1 Tax=Xylanibacillus composti TaxID=1572762 RepID=A0A8J4H3G8_9BACL|nr:M50 family metallopeptidase [Xylanibacillus composti]GIQ70169.1 stage IV sporulation protein FB [Xylanibacillus composti]
MIKGFGQKHLGFRFRIHPLFHFVLAFSVLTGAFVEIITLFVIVLAHEMGHVGMAKALGWQVQEVQLLPFGGVAIVEDKGAVPVLEELAVAAAGPLQHVWLIGFAWLMRECGWWSVEWSQYFIEANLMIGMFNLLPILPLDGGKIVQALISCYLSYYRALQATAWASLATSVLFLTGALSYSFAHNVHLNAIAIGLFLCYANWEHKRGLPYHFVRFLMKREQFDRASGMALPIIVHREQTVGEIVRMLMRDRQHLIYIADEHGGIRRIIREQALIRHYFNRNNGRSAVSSLFM